LLNLLIEYRRRIDVIYIDPPYGKDSMGDFAQTNYDNAITRDNLYSFTQNIVDTWQFIFEKWLPNSPFKYYNKGINFEMYDERCHEKNNKVIDIYIPISLKNKG
jgi:16S rRNA G966 N2-methylase RsmD